MKKSIIFAGLLGAASVGAASLAQDRVLATGPTGSASKIKQIPAWKLKVPPLIDQIVVELKTGGDGLRAGSVITQQLVLQDGRSEFSENLKYWDFSPGSYGFSADTMRAGINANADSRFVIRLPRPMALKDIREYNLKLSFDGVPRSWPESYDNWNIDQIRIFTSGTCEYGQGRRERVADVGRSSQTRGQAWRTLGAQQTKLIVPMNVTGQPGSERISKLDAEFWTGSDGIRSGAVLTATVRMADGTTYPKVNLNNGDAWDGGSVKKAAIALPTPTLASSISQIEIDFDGAGRSLGENYDNWDVSAVNISSLEACQAHVLFENRGTPWWRTSPENSEKTLNFRRYP